MLGKSSCDWLIVGLGNPGKQYDGTRHNCGFLAIDRVAETLQVKIDRVKFRGLTAMATYAGQKLCLLKPETFMNLSGIAVMQAANFYKIPPERVLVLFDDISLSVGRIRVRATALPVGTTASNPSSAHCSLRTSHASRSASAANRTRITTWPTGCSALFPRPIRSS